MFKTKATLPFSPRLSAVVTAAALAVAAPAFAGGQAAGPSDKAHGASAGMQMQQDSQRGSQATSGSMSSDVGAAKDTQASGSLETGTVRQLQQALKDKGHDIGSVDGVWGQQTAEALRKFQQAQGLPSTGQPDRQTLSALGVDDASGSGGGSTAVSGSAGSGGSTAVGGSTTGSGSTGSGSMGSGSMGSGSMGASDTQRSSGSDDSTSASRSATGASGSGSASQPTAGSRSGSDSPAAGASGGSAAGSDMKSGSSYGSGGSSK